MKRFTAVVVLAAFVVLGTICAVQAATPDDAKAMVEKAYAALKANGKEKAFAEISNPGGQFVKGDLYVFVNDFNGICLANGGNPKFVGMNHFALKDPDGRYFIREMVEVAKTKGSGWVNYMWINPTTKKLQAKATFVKRIEGSDSFMASGVFK